MIEYCVGCKKRHKDRYWRKNDDGWFCSVFYKPMGKTDKQFAEYIATPFWKIAGLPPKPHEIALEKQLKAKNMTYRDLEQQRLRTKKSVFDSSDLKQKLYKGKLKQIKPQIEYQKA